MKKLIYLIVIMLVLGLIISGCSLLGVTPAEKDEITSLTKAKPGTDFRGPHYNLNLIGKKEGWSGGGSYDNPNRHTIFVPEDTSEYVDVYGGTGITIWMSRGDEFAVLDGNACGLDDGVARFQLGPGKYKVYIVAKAKPGGDTNITSWIFDPYTTELYSLVGTLNVGGHSKNWKNATDLFYYKGDWVFDWLEDCALTVPDDAYFWQYDNKGNKLVKVRFYPDPEED